MTRLRKDWATFAHGRFLSATLKLRVVAMMHGKIGKLGAESKVRRGQLSCSARSLSLLTAVRLIICLLTTDWWFSDAFRVAPIIQTDCCDILLPCSNFLFQCPTEARWRQAVNGQALEFGAIVSCPGGFDIQMPRPDSPADTMSMYAIFAAIRLRLHTSAHDVLRGPEGLPDSSVHTAVPWDWHESNPSTAHILDLMLRLPNSPSLASMTANSTAIWHHTCISLLADLPTFELAAGQAGSDLARPAWRYIGEWTSSQAARRACVHAAQAFRAMTERRVNEGVMFTAVPLLFQCALVLGFYILLRAKSATHDASSSSEQVYDLVGTVDWNAVGREGFSTSDPSRPEADGDVDPTVGFIRNGYGLCFGNSLQAPSLQSAKVVFLDFASLLDDVATKWKIGDYANILRVLSDTAFE